MQTDQIIAKVDKKDTRLGVHWNNLWINCCSLSFASDNSFHFSSNFHIKGNLQFGSASLKDNYLYQGLPDQNHHVSNGFHTSLHPRGQCIHVKDNQTGKILFKRNIKWFPVAQPFSLLVLYSPPLDCCLTEKDRSKFNAPIPKEYKDSIQIRVDIFPKDTREHFPYIRSIWIFWGRCPEYLVRISINLLGTRTPACLYWASGNELKL